ncbi:MAG: hypothetical protein ACRYHQ_10650 [Janthinobacterium lividum]
MLSRERPRSAIALPMPAPLPPLTTALSRRAALFGAVTVSGALASSAAMAMVPAGLTANDRRLAELADAYVALDATVNAMSTDAPGYDDLLDGFTSLEAEMAETPADTMTGVLAKARTCQSLTLRGCVEGVSLSIADDLHRLFGGGAHA